jgi:hypothetical protein
MAAIRPLAPGGRPGIGDRARGEAAAVSVALSRHRSGSKAVGVTVARVQAPAAGLGTPRVVWLVSVDPYGGEYPTGSTACSGAVIWPANYVIDVVGVTGRWLARWPVTCGACRSCRSWGNRFRPGTGRCARRRSRAASAPGPGTAGLSPPAGPRLCRVPGPGGGVGPVIILLAVARFLGGAAPCVLTEPVMAVTG